MVMSVCEVYDFCKSLQFESSAGLRVCSGGALSVNWKVVTKSGAALKSGDVVSLRGKGRIEVRIVL